MTSRTLEHPITAIREVIDGDSLRLVLDLGYRIEYVVYCRLDGVDAPELTTGAGK